MGWVRVLPTGTMGGLAVERYLEVAARAGFEAVSLRPAVVAAWVSASPGRTPARLGERVRSAGLAVAELDPVVGWHDPGPDGAVDQVARRHLGWAAELGARQVTALVPPGADHRPGSAAEGLARLVEEAAALGVAVQVEPFAWSSLHDLADAAALVEAAGPPGAVGLMVDTWHLARAGGDREVIAHVPVARVHGVQVADGPAAPVGPDRAEENRSGRRWPGDGELRPDAVVTELAGRGWAGPVAVEVFGPAGPDPEARARRAAEALDRVLLSVR